MHRAKSAISRTSSPNHYDGNNQSLSPNQLSSHNNTNNNNNNLHNINVEDFNLEDRESVLQTLLSQERVITLLYAKTFPVVQATNTSGSKFGTSKSMGGNNMGGILNSLNVAGGLEELLFTGDLPLNGIAEEFVGGGNGGNEGAIPLSAQQES